MLVRIVSLRMGKKISFHVDGSVFSLVCIHLSCMNTMHKFTTHCATEKLHHLMVRA